MIGSALKKMAAENGMKVAKGVAYGSLKGYCATLFEGAGYKQIVLVTRFPEISQQDNLRNEVSTRNITKEFRVQNLTFAPNGISIVFTDNPGTMAKIHAFIDWFFPLLEQYGATKAGICPECGCAVEAGRWVLQDGVAAMYVHEACAQKLERELEAENEEKKQTGQGSYWTGLLGAFLGSFIGSIAWALVLMLGYVASIIGFVIGWLANKGYDLLKGKQGKGKVVILAFAVIFGVLLGTLLPDVVELVRGIGTGEYFLTYGEIPMAILSLLLYEPEYARAVLADSLMGLLFAALGVFALLRKTRKEVADSKLITLE